MWISLCRYEVYCENLLTHGVIGLLVAVVTQTNKHRLKLCLLCCFKYTAQNYYHCSVSYATKCMEKFVHKFSETISKGKKSDYDAQVRCGW